MKKLLALFVAILTLATATAQEEYSIILDQSSFRAVQVDPLTGVNIDPIAKDLSRNACARVKIKFAKMNKAQIDALEVKMRSNTDLTKQKVADYYDNVLILEMTAKPNTRFYFLSPEFGESNEVTLNLEGNREYEMLASLNQTFSIVVSSNAENVDIYLDDVFKGKTDGSKSLTIKEVMIGAHTLKAVYGTVSSHQRIEVNSGSILFRQDVNTAANKPQYVVFAVEPQSAVVTINNTPYPLTEGSMMAVLESGTYNYVVAAAGYHSQSGIFTVSGQKVEMVVTLKADAAKVTLTAPNNADIWVNGVKKGTSRWSGTFTSGVYIFEARKVGHRPATMSQKITSDNPNQSYTLPAPIPMVGTLAVGSTPLMADVAVDGKAVGRTPIDINDLIVGEHKVTVSKQGYSPYTQTITVSEGKTATVNATLAKYTPPTPKPAPPAPSGSYKIGDIVTVNGVKGVVFQISPQVKIVSVKETTATWGEYGVKTGATDSDNGKANMAKIKSISGWQSKYPAFKWCSDLGEGWYLPAKNELKAIYNQRDAINKTLSANGFDTLGSKDKYSCIWSSSEGSNYYACGIGFSNGCVYSYSKNIAQAQCALSSLFKSTIYLFNLFNY